MQYIRHSIAIWLLAVNVFNYVWPWRGWLLGHFLSLIFLSWLRIKIFVWTLTGWIFTILGCNRRLQAHQSQHDGVGSRAKTDNFQSRPLTKAIHTSLDTRPQQTLLLNSNQLQEERAWTKGWLWFFSYVSKIYSRQSWRHLRSLKIGSLVRESSWSNLWFNLNHVNLCHRLSLKHQGVVCLP